MTKMFSEPTNSVLSKLGRQLLLASAVGLGLGATAVSAQEIRVWSGYPELAPFYEHVAEGMKADYPDLSVKVEAIALREHEKRLALGLTSGEAAEVIELGTSTATRYLENGLFNTAPDDVAAFVQDPANFNDFFRDSASYDGTVSGVPLFRGQSALYYNTDMFEAAGLTEPPADMAEYTKYAEALTQRDANGAPTVSGWSLRLSGGGQGIAEKFWINMFQYGENLVEQSADGKWKADFANEQGRAALKQYLENVHTLKTVTIEMPADAEAFERGQTAMFIRESWVIGDIKQKAPNLKYATAPLPRGSIALVTNLYVTADSDKGKMAWEFAKATTEPANLVWLLDNVGWLPNRKDVDYSSVTSRTPAFNAFLQYPPGYTFFTLPAIAPIEEILTRLAARLTRGFTDPALAKDDAAIDAFLSEAAKETSTILRRADLLGSN